MSHPFIHSSDGHSVFFACSRCDEFTVGSMSIEVSDVETDVFLRYGMRALGLPNTKHFHEITQIKDALAREFLPIIISQPSWTLCIHDAQREEKEKLTNAPRSTVAEKLKYEGRAELAAMDRAEEMEDDDGTVYDKRTYLDLKKQGVI